MRLSPILGAEAEEDHAAAAIARLHQRGFAAQELAVQSITAQQLSRLWIATDDGHVFTLDLEDRAARVEDRRLVRHSVRQWVGRVELDGEYRAGCVERIAGPLFPERWQNVANREPQLLDGELRG